MNFITRVKFILASRDRKLFYIIHLYLSQMERSVDVIDFGAGKRWVHSDKIQSYTATDLSPSIDQMKYNFDDSLPMKFVNKFDLALVLGTWYYSQDPIFSLGQFIKSLKTNGFLIIHVPIRYPNHDKASSQWRGNVSFYRTTLSKYCEVVDWVTFGNFLNFPDIFVNHFKMNRFDYKHQNNFRVFSKSEMFPTDAVFLVKRKNTTH